MLQVKQAILLAREGEITHRKSKMRIILLIFLLQMSHIALADCIGSEEEISIAVKKLYTISEVKNWQKFILSHSGKKTKVLSFKEPNLMHKGCYIHLSVHVDEGDHLTRWHDFYLDSRRNSIYIDNSEGELLSLSKWRSTKDGKSWRTNNLTPKS